MRFPELPTIVWCDMMKCGRTSMYEIDEFATLISHVLHKRPKGVAIVIAPFLVSEKQAGYRGQLRIHDPFHMERNTKKHIALNLTYSGNIILCLHPTLVLLVQELGRQDGC